ncbi:putative oxidoreductase [Azospirillum agricola]|uniref:DoxX family protein n=1 Tax=Azospirillum agricola TaxID=1720247 RepID=UPI001AE40DAD|nr:DoxX family membrane protein [Azospirillum agricola]MBP2230168.1 putative oxidoreductase [Azospirillum agricola]
MSATASNTAAAGIDSRTAPYAALVLRVGLGLLFLAHGLLLKVLTFGVAGTVGFFESLGYPGFLAYLVILGEIGGGLLLIAGAYTRWISLALLPIMIGATLQHVGNGWLFTAPNGGWEFPAFWTALLAVQALLGDGAFAVKVPALTATAPATAGRSQAA